MRPASSGRSGSGRSWHNIAKQNAMCRNPASWALPRLPRPRRPQASGSASNSAARKHKTRTATKTAQDLRLQEVEFSEEVLTVLRGRGAGTKRPIHGTEGWSRSRLLRYTTQEASGSWAALTAKILPACARWATRTRSPTAGKAESGTSRSSSNRC